MMPTSVASATQPHATPAVGQKPTAAPGGAAGAFAALLSALTGGGTQATGEAVAGQLGQNQTPGPSAGTGTTLTQAGANGTELLATKVRLASGLRQFEAEVRAAVTSALAQGRADQAQAILTGAAKALGCIFAQLDGSAQTNTLSLLQQGLPQSEPISTEPGTGQADGPAATETADKSKAADPLAQLEALFGWVSSALGLVRPPAPPPAAAQPSEAGGPYPAPNSKGQPDAKPADTTQSGAALEMLASAQASHGSGQSAPPSHHSAAAEKPDVSMAPQALALQAINPAASTAAADIQALARALVAAGEPMEKAPGNRDSGQTPAASASPPPSDFFGLVAAGAVAVPTPATGKSPADPSQATTSTEAARFSGYITDQIRSAKLDGDRMTVALKPAGLGAVEVEVKRGDGGQLQVVVRADNPMVLSALRSNQDQLSAILAASGFNATGSTLDFQDFSGKGQAPQQGRTRTAAISAGGEDDGDAADWQQTIGAGRLDIRT